MFSGIEKGCIENKWVKGNICEYIDHLASKCREKISCNDPYNITLYQSNLNS